MSQSKRRKQYWLFKSEPDVYSIDDFEKDGVTSWEGIRNYQARNLIRDDMKVGDGVLFYHSNAKPLAVVGIGRICKEAYPDHFAFEKGHKYFDAKSDPDNPAWMMVDVEWVETFEVPVERAGLMDVAELEDMMVLKRGARLSVQPVTAKEWKVVLKMAGSQTTL